MTLCVVCWRRNPHEISRLKSFPSSSYIFFYISKDEMRWESGNDDGEKKMTTTKNRRVKYWSFSWIFNLDINVDVVITSQVKFQIWNLDEFIQKKRKSVEFEFESMRKWDSRTPSWIQLSSNLNISFWSNVMKVKREKKIA